MYLDGGSPCGIGGPSDPGGPCTGVYSPSDAGRDAFAGISSAKVISAIIAAGVLIAAVLFAVYLSRRVGNFFRARKKRQKPDAEFTADAYRDHRPDADFTDAVYRDPRDRDSWLELDHEDDTEDDTEDDSETFVARLQ